MANDSPSGTVHVIAAKLSAIWWPATAVVPSDPINSATAPNKLARAGWTKRTLEPGDHIVVSGTPHKDGSHVIQIRKLVAPDGKDLQLNEQ